MKRCKKRIGRTALLLPAMMMVAVIIAVSCSQNPKSGSADELVAIDFGEISRSLESSTEAFDKDSLYWFYAAKKSTALDGSMIDGSGLKSGETVSYNRSGAVKVSDGTGLGTVTGFSQGLWDFMLFGCKRSGAEDSYTYSVAYIGEAFNVSLKKGSANSVNITVSPVSTEGNGTLVVDTENITFNAVQDETECIADFTKVVTVTRLSDSEVQGSTGTSYSLVPDVYRVTVAFAHTMVSDTYIYAEGSVLATVYSNLTTRVYGDLSELVTYVRFDAD